LITRTILGEDYRSLSSSLRSFLHSPVTSSFLGPDIRRQCLWNLKWQDDDHTRFSIAFGFVALQLNVLNLLPRHTQTRIHSMYVNAVCTIAVTNMAMMRRWSLTIQHRLSVYYRDRFLRIYYYYYYYYCYYYR
jgi:hypothetical protein